MKRAIRVEAELRYHDEHVERLIKRFLKKVKKERIVEQCLERKRSKSNTTANNKWCQF